MTEEGKWSRGLSLLQQAVARMEALPPELQVDPVARAQTLETVAQELVAAAQQEAQQKAALDLKWMTQCLVANLCLDLFLLQDLATDFEPMLRQKANRALAQTERLPRPAPRSDPAPPQGSRVRRTG